MEVIQKARKKEKAKRKNNFLKLWFLSHSIILVYLFYRDNTVLYFYIHPKIYFHKIFK